MLFEKIIKIIKRKWLLIALIIFLLSWLVFFVSNVYSDIVKIQQLEKDNLRLEEKLTSEKQENAELEDFAAQDDKTLKEEIARREYGYIYPDEHVYIDIAPGR